MRPKHWLAMFGLAISVCPISAQSATIGMDFLGAWTDPITSGNIRRLDATVRFSPRIRPEVGFTVFVSPSVALTISDTRGRLPTSVTQAGAQPGHSTVHMDSRAAILKLVHGTGNFDGYAGIGVTRPGISSLRPLSSGSLTLIRASSPDHGALLVNVGASYRLASHLHLVGDVKYEPFPSTAEIRRSIAPNDDLESNFHLLLIGTGISLRF